MESKIVRIPSRLYSDIYQVGGDKLLAVFCTLKAYRGKSDKYYAFKSRNHKSIGGYSLLRSKTNLSLSVIQKYVPMLINMGLCSIDSSGNVSIAGNDKLKSKFNNKLVPIRIGKNFIDTSYNTISVRLSSEERQQRIQIGIKTHRRDLLLQLNDPKTAAAYKEAKRVVDKYGSSISVTECVVMSNAGFAALKDGTQNNKHKGAYWKKKLKQKGLISTKRRFKRVMKASFEEYKQYRVFSNCPQNTKYSYGYIVEELVSNYSSIDLVSGEMISELAIVG